MRYIRKITTVILVLVTSSFFLIACSDSPTDSGGTAKVQGQVTDEDGNDGFTKPTGGVEGATVTMVRASSDGSFEAVSTSSVETDANGYFTVETDVENESNLIVQAEKNGMTWRSVVTAEVQSDATVESKPMTEESTVEAGVYAEARADGSADTWTSTSIKSNINASVATEVRGNTSAYADLAAAIQNEADAEAAALMEISNKSQADVDAIAEAQADAQANLESNLYAAGSSSAKEQAYTDFYSSVEAGYEDEDVNDKERSKALSVSGKVLVESASNLDSDVRTALKQKSSTEIAAAMDDAVQAQLNTIGASQNTVQAAADANAALQTRIESAQTMSDIEAAFSTYHDSVVAHTQTAAESNANIQSSVVADIDSGINASGGAKATLDAAIQAAIATGINVNAIVTAYTEFFSAIRSTVESSFSTAGSAEVEAVTDLLILANISV